MADTKNRSLRYRFERMGRQYRRAFAGAAIILPFGWMLAQLPACAQNALPTAPAAVPPAAVPPAAVPPAAVPPAVFLTAPTHVVSIGPGLFTFPQIAALLSTPEQPITCDPSLKERAAFVHLKDRSREQAQALLAAGLQVEFLPITKPTGSAPAGLVMGRQKAVAEREVVWMRRLTRLLQNELDKQVDAVAAQSDLPLPDRAKNSQMLMELADLAEAVGEPPWDKPPATDAIAQKRKRVETLETAVEAAYKVPDAHHRMVGAWAKENPAVISSLLQGAPETTTVQPFPALYLKNGWATQALLDGLSSPTGIHLSVLPTGFQTENYQWVAGYKAEGVLSSQIRIVARANLVHLSSPVSEALVAQANKTLQVTAGLTEEQLRSQGEAKVKEHQDALVAYYLNIGTTTSIHAALPENVDEAALAIPGALSALGAEAIAWWKQEEAETQPCLAGPLSAPNAEQKQVSDGGALMGTQYDNVGLSDALERFVGKTKAEGIMELHPRAEMWQTEKDAPALSAWVVKSRWPHQWSVRQQDKVFLITNRLSFIERPQTVPLTELLQLRADLQAWKNAHPVSRAFPTSHFPPYEPLAAYTRAVVARREGRTWSAIGNPWSYHQIHLEKLDTSTPVLYLWSQIRARDRARLVARLSAASPSEFRGWNSETVPLSRLSDTALKTLASLLRERRLRSMETETPQYLDMLRSLSLKVSLYNNPQVNTPGRYPLTLSVLPSKDYPSVFVGFMQAEFVLDMPPSGKGE